MIRFALLVLSIILVACGNDLVYSDNDKHILQDAFFVFDDSSNTMDSLDEQNNILIKVNSTKTLSSAAYLNEEKIDSKKLPDFYFLRYWSYKKSNLISESITLTPEEKPFKTCHYSIDFVGDTLTQCFNIFADHPLNIDLRIPANKENEIDKKTKVAFFANIVGIDSLEKNQCELFLTEAKENLWKAKATEFTCNDTIQISIGEAEIYYWAIQAKTESLNATDSVRSETFMFFTKPQNKKSNVIVPIRYKGDRGFEKKGIVNVKQKDSILLTTEIYSDTILDLENLPEDENLKLEITETIRLDYKKDSIEFIIKPKAHNLLDTIVLQDDVPPEAFPLKNEFLIDEPILFYAAENGSGLNAIHSSVIYANTNDSLKYKYNGSRFMFTSPCEAECYIQIHLEDNAGNKSPKKLWKLKTFNEFVKISGPID